MDSRDVRPWPYIEVGGIRQLTFYERGGAAGGSPMSGKAKKACFVIEFFDPQAMQEYLKASPRVRNALGATPIS